MLLGFSNSCNRLAISASPLAVGLPGSDQVPHPRQVVGGGGEGDFHSHFLQSAPTELPQAPLFLEHSKHRLHPSLAPPVNRPAQLSSQLLPHLSMHRVYGAAPQPPTPVQHSSQIR